MSLYNMLHGTNPMASYLLAFLDIDQEGGKFQSGRFRDIYLNEDGTKIILYTRNGGGNREEYQHIFDTFADEHPNYVRDWDDDFDCTYAYIEFTVPEKYKHGCKALATGEKPETVHDKFKKTMAEMKDMSTDDLKKDNRFKPVVDLMDKISDELR